jgi:hypothetical protein
MKSLLIWNRETEDILCSVCIVPGNETTFEDQISARCLDADNYDFEYIDGGVTTRQAKKEYCVRNGQLVNLKQEDDYLLSRRKEAKNTRIIWEFHNSMNNPVVCTLPDGRTFEMDAGEENARRLKDGIELEKLLGNDTIDIRDYHNNTHVGISLDDALEIAKQQGLDYAKKRKRKIEAQDALKAITLDDPDWEEKINNVSY